MIRTIPACLLACLLAAAPTMAADWVRVDTPSFVVYGDAGVSRVRDIATEFERFREAMGKVLPEAIARSPVPTTVVVFGTRRAYDPYRPSFNGRKIEVAGYFYSNEDENVVALAMEDRAQALRTTLHEYAHILMSNLAWDIPAWANEGLAEYYSTFTLSSNGREGTLGQVLPAHLDLLREQKLLGLRELLGVTVDSPLYNEGNRRSVFYAESWALVHMLMSATPDRSAELMKYVRTAAAGVPPEEAWRQAFGSFDVIEELKRYLDRNTLTTRLYRFDEGVRRDVAPTVPLSASEIEAMLAGIARRTDGLEAAEARLVKARALTPESAHVAAVLGLIRLEQQRDDEARTLLLAASRQQADWLVQYRVAYGLRRLIAVQEGSTPADVVAAARRALDTVRAARPDLVQPLALAAEIDAATRTDLDNGLAAIRRARELSPGRESYAFVEAQIRAASGQFAAARAILEPMTTAAYRPDVRDHASVMLRNAAREERAASHREDLASTAPDDQPVVPIYRTPKPGEQRIEGVLEQIECARDAIYLHVRAGTRALKFEARSLEAVEFLTFRASQTGLVVCGPRTPPDPVYLTWRPFPPPAALRTSDGEAVAVEFIPK